MAFQDFLYLFGILGGMLACLKLPLAGLLYVCKSLAHSKATYAMFRKPWGLLSLGHTVRLIARGLCHCGAFQIDAV